MKKSTTLSRAARAAALASLALAGASTAAGCKRVRKALHRHHRAAAVARHAPRPAVAPGHCEDEQRTPPAAVTLRAQGRVDQLAVAGGARGALVLAVVDGVVQAAAVPAALPRGRNAPPPAFAPLGTGHAGADHENDPQVVALGDGFVAAWRRTHANLEYLVSVRVRADGTPVGEERALQLDDARAGVALATSGTGYALEHVTGGAVTVELFTPDGAPQGNPILLPGSAGASSPALAWMDPTYLAAWVTTETPPATVLVAQILPARGSAQQLSGMRTAGASPRPSLAASRERFVLAYTDTPPDAPEGAALFAAAFENTGVRLVDPVKVGDRALAAAPDVAWDGAHFGVAWTERVGGEGASQPRWAALDTSAAVVGAALQVRDGNVAEGPPVEARLAWDGAGYVLARRGAVPGEVAVHRFGARGCDAR